MSNISRRNLFGLSAGAVAAAIAKPSAAAPAVINIGVDFAKDMTSFYMPGASPWMIDRMKASDLFTHCDLEIDFRAHA